MVHLNILPWPGGTQSGSRSKYLKSDKDKFACTNSNSLFFSHIILNFFLLKLYKLYTLCILNFFYSLYLIVFYYLTIKHIFYVSIALNLTLHKNVRLNENYKQKLLRDQSDIFEYIIKTKLQY